VRFRAVPGNHDVGDAGHRSQPLDEERLRRWRAQFGPDRWVEDVENYRLIGLDALLLGSGDPEEATQDRCRDRDERCRGTANRLVSPPPAVSPQPG
jgi:hypothetical protein